ncbi:MAG: hypothetical protein ACP5E4_02590, partial [Candidatus Aenigmatarchaeota archaeon]
MQALKKTGWKGLEKALSVSRPNIIKTVRESGLSGRSGSNFPTGLKWELVAKGRGKKYLICNADEGEPGTFKDRFILEKYAYQLLEGMTIAGYAIGSSKGIIYLRA